MKIFKNNTKDKLNSLSVELKNINDTLKTIQAQFIANNNIYERLCSLENNGIDALSKDEILQQIKFLQVNQRKLINAISGLQLFKNNITELNEKE